MRNTGEYFSVLVIYLFCSLSVCLLSKHLYLKACCKAQSVQRCHAKCHVPSNDMGLENAQRCDNSPLRCLLKFKYICLMVPSSQPADEKYMYLL